MKQIIKFSILIFLLIVSIDIHGQQLWWKIEKNRKEYSLNYYYEWLKNTKPLSNERDNCLEAIKTSMPGILYDTLKFYSHNFLSSINYKLEYNSNVAWLFGLLELPDSVKQFVLNDTLTPLYVKARLGNKKAEQVVLNEFKWRIIDRKDSITLTWDDRNIIPEVLYINSKRAKKYFVKGFQTKAYYYDEYLSSNSSHINVNTALLTDMFFWYSTFYKNETIKEILTSSGYMVLQVSDDIRNVTDIKDQFKKLQKQLRKQYKVRVRILAPYLRKASNYKWYMSY